MKDQAEYLLKLSRSGGAVVPYRSASGTAFLVNEPSLAYTVLRDIELFESPPHPFPLMLPLASVTGHVLLGQGARRAEHKRRAIQECIAAASNSIAESKDNYNTLSTIELYRYMRLIATSVALRLLFDLNDLGLAAAFSIAADDFENALAGEDFYDRADAFQNLLDSLRGHKSHTGIVDASPSAMRSATITLLNASVPLSYALLWSVFGFANRHESLGQRHSVSANVSGPAMLRPFVTEALRLFPPVWAVSRTVRKETVLAETTLPMGSDVVVSPYTLHRSRPWSWPDVFDENRARAGVGAMGPFIPFGYGPRRCPAAAYAPRIIQHILSAFLASINVQAAGFPDVHALVALRPCLKNELITLRRS